VQSVNDLGLHHQFLARGVTTVKGTLAEGEAYLLANQMHKNRGVSRQVEVEPAAAQIDPNAGLPVTAAVGQLTAASKVAQLTDMLAKLVSALTPKNPVDIAREPLGPLAQSPGTTSNLCWECGRPRHFQRYCSLVSQRLNYRGTQMLPPTAGRR